MSTQRLDELIHALLDGVITDPDLAELQRQLAACPHARQRYLRSASLHSRLLSLNHSPLPSFLQETTPSRPPLRFPVRLAAIAAALAAIAIPAFLLTRQPPPRAEITASHEVRCPPGSAAPSPGPLKPHQPVTLLAGWIEITFPSGAAISIDAPCHFQLDQPETLTLFHGRAAVHVPPGAEGFRLDTPGGEIIDLGTAFSVAVGSDGSHPVVLTEVFDGEIEIHAGQQSPARLRGGEARAIVGHDSGLHLVSTLDDSPIHVPRPIARPTPAPEKNLALGKPVFSPGYCVRPHGSVFPPDNVTDGRTDDSGVPGDWSFWLAPDGASGEFTVDLIDPATISRVSLQNTANRGIADRGTARFLLLGSLDNHHFTPLIEDRLPAITPGSPHPFHDFRFPPTRVRFVKFIVLEHLRHPGRPADHPLQGGGLSEIRIFEN